MPRPLPPRPSSAGAPSVAASKADRHPRSEKQSSERDRDTGYASAVSSVNSSREDPASARSSLETPRVS